MKHEAFRQVLPDLDLSLERYTEAVPDDGAWYLVRAGEQVGRFRTRKEALDAWKAALDEAGWEAPKRRVDTRETLLREARERWARNRGG